MTQEQAGAALLSAGATLRITNQRTAKEHRGCIYACSVSVWVMPISRKAVTIFATPAVNGWQLGPDSLLEENLMCNRDAVTDAIDYEKIAKVMELCS